MSMYQRGTASTIIAMVIAGLIVYAIIFYGPEIWEKIQQKISGTISVEELREHSAKYMGKKVTVEGKFVRYEPGNNNNGFISDGMFLFTVKNIPAGLIQNSKYKFTGIVKLEERRWPEVYDWQEGSAYLDVISVAPV